MAQPYEIAKILWAAKKLDVDPNHIQDVEVCVEEEIHGDTFGEFTVVTVKIRVAETAGRNRDHRDPHYIDEYDKYDFDRIVKEIIEAGEGLT